MLYPSRVTPLTFADCPYRLSDLIKKNDGSKPYKALILEPPSVSMCLSATICISESRAPEAFPPALTLGGPPKGVPSAIGAAEAEIPKEEADADARLLVGVAVDNDASDLAAPFSVLSPPCFFGELLFQVQVFPEYTLEVSLGPVVVELDSQFLPVTVHQVHLSHDHHHLAFQRFSIWKLPLPVYVSQSLH